MASDSSLEDDLSNILFRDPASEDPFRPIWWENPNLPRFLDNLEKSTYWYKPWEGPVEKLDLFGFRFLLGGQAKGVIMIEEVGNKAVSMLKRAFPDLDLAFVHRHVARSVSDDVGATFSSVAHDIEIRSFSVSRGESESPFGLHFDGHCVPSTIGNIRDLSNDSTDLAFSFMESRISFRGYRNETLVKHGETWRIASTRISCCLLKSDLCELPSDPDKAKEIWLTEHRPAAHRRTTPPALSQYKRSSNDANFPNTTKRSI